MRWTFLETHPLICGASCFLPAPVLLLLHACSHLAPRLPTLRAAGEACSTREGICDEDLRAVTRSGRSRARE